MGLVNSEKTVLGKTDINFVYVIKPLKIFIA